MLDVCPSRLLTSSSVGALGQESLSRGSGQQLRVCLRYHHSKEASAAPPRLRALELAVADLGMHDSTSISSRPLVLKVSEEKKKKLLKPIHGSISLGSTGTFMQESCQHPLAPLARNLDAGRVLRKLWVLKGPCFFACVSATSFCKRRFEKA